MQISNQTDNHNKMKYTKDKPCNICFNDDYDISADFDGPYLDDDDYE
jgi:hypothetical protein